MSDIPFGMAWLIYSLKLYTIRFEHTLPHSQHSEAIKIKYEIYCKCQPPSFYLMRSQMHNSEAYRSNCVAKFNSCTLFYGVCSPFRLNFPPSPLCLKPKFMFLALITKQALPWVWGVLLFWSFIKQCGFHKSFQKINLLVL